MTQEEKARRYDEIIKKAQKWYDANTNEGYRGIFEDIFPELAESEDERIRKMVLKAFKLFAEKQAWVGHCLDDIDWDACIAWLERQAKQKPAVDTKVIIPKFRVGDIVKSKSQPMLSPRKIISIGKDCYWCEDRGCIGFAWEDDYEIVEQKPTLPRWKYKNDSTPLLRDSIILNKYGCVAKSPSGAMVSDVWVIDYDELAKLPKEELENKVEPKFKVEKDRWYVCTSQYCNCIEGRNYKASLDGRIIDDYGTEYDMHSDAYRWFRPWTIQDAKDGDVLYNEDIYREDSIFIFKSISSSTGAKLYYVRLFKQDEFCIGNKTEWEKGTGVYGGLFHPATKEQRDLLFQKMKEAGYEWDAEKKELKKVEQTSADETPYPETLEKAIDLYYYSYGNGEGEFEHLSLEKFRDIVHTFVSDYGQNTAWSEEDLCKIENALFGTYAVDVATRLLDKIKSLRPQTTWKPSKEQMKAFENVYDWYRDNSNFVPSIPLHELYKDLKKLKE